MVSKKWLSALGAVAICTAGCATSDPSAPEQTGNTSSAQVIAPLACAPILTTTLPLLSCGAMAASSVALASSIQTSIMASMQTAFTSLTLTPDLVANQVVLTSTAPAFTTFFGPQIIAPLTPIGWFTAAIPFPIGTLAPGFNLTASVFGIVPGMIPPIATVTPALLPPLVTPVPFAPFGAASTAAFSTAAATSTATTAAFSAATMPLTFFITTPIVDGFPITCSGAIPLTCL
jgi:hypothetical protein